MKMSVHIEEWKLTQPFRISGYEWVHTRLVMVQLMDQGHIGRGEAEGVFYLDETAERLYEQVNDVRSEIESGITREELQKIMPAGGARNALDCAMWDLECKKAGKTIWQLTGIQPRPVTTVFTLGLESTPEAMAAKAISASDAPVLKIKLDADRPYEKLAAIREARPDAVLVVDANQGWDFDLLQDVLPRFAKLDLGMIEQPLPRGHDEQLEGFDSPITLAADESCLHCEELQSAAKRYGMINIKLDKTGGLTEALKLAKAAKAQGLKLMVGNMTGTSLAMAPAFVIAQLCDFVDIDGPLLLQHDHLNGLQYEKGVVRVFGPELWG
ncbi:MAG: N-acetyl-D-Glu racemase DgcA [Xanthomonadales bacterium]|jgi:L-alanine-DL-glutamate epimerase-like enolase superfamily enzyme|nr:N-acetyl-D-Glu racemase DgcA [Xanthomonadales bacterium]